MYHDYFGLKEPAFSIAVNPKYLYMSNQHKEALAHLLYGVQGGGFVLLSGEVGTGKTTIIRCLLEQLPEKTEIAFVLNPMAGVASLLNTICEELQLKLISDEEPTIKQMMDSLQAHLLHNHTHGLRTILLIDEAQLLSAEVLEQIRLLTNLETNTEKLLQIILVGQPEVNELLSQPRLRQLSQRITARFHLEPLNLTETHAYIEHRLSVAGKKDGSKIFPTEIIEKIHAFSGGIPRLINILCERLLVGAYGHNKFEIDSQIYKLAIKEVEGVKTSSVHKVGTKYPEKWIWGAIAGAFIVLTTLLIILLTRSEKATPEIATVNKIEYIEQEPQIDIAPTIVAPPEIVPVVVAPEAPPYFHTSGAAYAKIFSYYGETPDNQSHPCWQTEQHNLSCSTTEMQTWQELEELNRPAILTLITEDKNTAYVLLIGINEDNAIIYNSDDEIIAIPRREIGLLWDGTVTYLWRKPAAYQKPIAIGTSSPVVTWVAEQFALLDGQQRPITRSKFTVSLQTRIKIFQTNNGLENDGIIGERTLMKLNEKVGVGITLLQSVPPLN